MGGVFKTIVSDGKVEYPDRPVGAPGSGTRAWRPGDAGRPPAPPARTKAEKDFDTAKQDIALARDDKGRTALDLATKKGHADVAEALSVAVASAAAASSTH